MTERTGYLSEAEVQAIQSLHKRAPYAITGVSQGLFSIARHHGGAVFQNCNYTYIDGLDELVRDDVFALVAKLRKKKEMPAQVQEKLI